MGALDSDIWHLTSYLLPIGLSPRDSFLIILVFNSNIVSKSFCFESDDAHYTPLDLLQSSLN